MALAGGLAVGACIADDMRDRANRPQPMIVGRPQTNTAYVTVTTIDETGRPKVMSDGSLPVPDRVLYKVTIPDGVLPGSNFLFKVEGKSFMARCPERSYPGDLLYVSLPGSSVLTGPIAQPHIESQAIDAIVEYNHLVDETKPENVRHNIVAAREGDRVKIIGGTIEHGRPYPYSEYCLVRFVDTGKVGNVSRFVLKYSPKEGTEPPPAERMAQT